MKRDPWNRCDVCGKFIPLRDFNEGGASSLAVRTLITPDSECSRETWETLCKEHSGIGARLEA